MKIWQTGTEGVGLEVQGSPAGPPPPRQEQGHPRNWVRASPLHQHCPRYCSDYELNKCLKKTVVL